MRIEKGKENQIEQTISLETLTAPICKGQKVGEAVYTLNNNELSKIDLIAAKDVEKINIFTMSKSVIYKWINLNRT